MLLAADEVADTFAIGRNPVWLVVVVAFDRLLLMVTRRGFLAGKGCIMV